jgi:hypothetical protein
MCPLWAGPLVAVNPLHPLTLLRAVLSYPHAPRGTRAATPTDKGIVSMSTRDGVFANSVIAALDTCANRRVPRAPVEDGGEPNEIGRTVAIIESAAARIDAGDFTAIESALAGQALALDVIFDQFARRSARGDLLFHDPMKMALRAQSQSRVTFKNLIALKNPNASRNSRKRTIENAKLHAGSAT